MLTIKKIFEVTKINLSYLKNASTKNCEYLQRKFQRNVLQLTRQCVKRNPNDISSRIEIIIGYDAVLQ